MAKRDSPRFDPDPLWYRDAVIYQLHVKSFFDANNDGVGDFPGLLSKLDYLCELGINAIWLLPFYPSPRRDDGYDIADYKNVHPEYGNLGDVRRLIAEAHARGIRVITELVVNHTSDRHPWFQRARRAKPGSAARDFYVWSNDDKAYAGTRIIFLDTEKSNWAWDDLANAYYWHRFYSHQPDLNFDNPRVLEAVLGVTRFWLDLGVDGLRLDAVPYLVEREGTNNENLPETHAILKRIRAEVDAQYPGRMLLAEANQWPEDVQAYFGNGDECHMLFHFPLMPRMYMAIAQEDRFPITDIMRQTPDIPANSQWAIFLRNHDELTLEMVTDKERDYLWKFYAADTRARLNLGIRRRLAPLLEHDRRRIELMNGLLLTMPGTPIIYYGDEIGMGDNLHLGDRDGVRTPMQWSPDRNGGFSRADPAALILPMIMDPIYGYEAVNVEAQLRDPHSLLNWLRRMLSVRGRHKAFGRGGLRFLHPQNRKVLAYFREHEGETILCVVNVSRSAQAVELDLSEFAGRTPIEMLGGAAFPAIGPANYLLTLPPYAFYWFLLSRSSEPPGGSTAISGAPPEYRTFVLRNGLSEVTEGAALTALESEVLPKYVAQRRWFQDRSAAIEAVEIVAAAPATSDLDFLFADIRVIGKDGSEAYALPLATAWDDAAPAPAEAPLALARVRRRARVGYLTDGFASAKFVRVLLEGFARRTSLPFGEGELVFRPMAGFDVSPSSEMQVSWLGAEQSISSLQINRKAIVKLMRQITTGVNAEVEMIRVLTERGYPAIEALKGEVTRQFRHGVDSVLAIVQDFVPNQGDGFRWTIEQLKRVLDEQAIATGSGSDPFELYGNFARRIGSRLGELHVTLAAPSQNADFAPEPVGEETIEAWRGSVSRHVEDAFAVLEQDSNPRDPESIGLIGTLHAHRAKLAPAIAERLKHSRGAVKTRVHGNFDLSHVLVAAGDVVFTDFGGDLLKPIQERRAKTHALRDAAGMLRSFDFAAKVAEHGEHVAKGGAGEERAVAVLEDFRRVAQSAFLNGYEQGRGVPLSSAEQDLLAVFALEKAAQECVAAAGQPEWLDVPLKGFARLTEQLVEGAS